MARLILFNKPFRVLSQFTDNANVHSETDSGARSTLADFIAIPNIYPAGRLDFDSEGLLLLTDSGPLQQRIASPKHKLPKTYWVQVEGYPDDLSLNSLRNGVTLKDGITRPADVSRLDEPELWPRNPPVRYRETVPTSWLRITISEGRNRQVRRMTAAVGHPTLRLVRASVGEWTLENLRPGEFHELSVHAPVRPGPANQRSDRRRKPSGQRRTNTP